MQSTTSPTVQCSPTSQITSVSTIPITNLENYIIKLNHEGFTVVSSTILDDKITLVATKNLKGEE